MSQIPEDFAAERRDIHFPPHDQPLRDNVRQLGALVGEMLAEQDGQKFYERVETVRTAAIQRRESGATVQVLARLLTGMRPAEAESLARAFATYFQMVNVAGRVHRIRRRREYQSAGAPPQPESLADALGRLKRQGVSRAELWSRLEALDVELVFTAHPTEAVRRSLLEKEQDIVRALIADFDPGRSAVERITDLARMRTALTTGWQTAEASSLRPSVQDELDHVGFYLAGPLYRALPVFYETLQRELETIYGTSPELPRILRFASWVGGDMDGNPNVGADTIAEALRTQRDQVIERYLEECAHLGRLLSQTEGRVEVSPVVREKLAVYRRQMPEAAAAIRPRHRDMPYRSLLALMGARLRAIGQDAENAYPHALAFETDVACIAESLCENKGEHAGLVAVRRLLWRVRSFGFHLARLDVRQDSRVHNEVLAVLLDNPDWQERTSAERTTILHPYASGEKAFGTCEDVGVEALRAVFATLAEARCRYGSEATGPYIISMAESAADVLAVLALARYGGLQDEAGQVPLDIAPLFETVDDLRNASETLRALLSDSLYRAHLTARDDTQLVMLGYSDSGKDGSLLTARWALQQAQIELLEVAHEAGVALTFFHGRGGSVSRGGSRIGPALLGSPRGAVAGRLRMTEQGEVIHRKYGIRALALRNLEQTVSGVLRASLRPRAAEPREQRWGEQMAVLARSSGQVYRALVTDPDFVAYFRSATPIDVIERMTLGSRPSRRRSMHGVEDLRAIPWVFAWMQCRCILPGWYGVGSALQHGVEQFGESMMTEMVSNWPFLETLLDDVEMVLAKSDLDIAEAFSRLSGPLHEHFFPQIRAEFERTLQGLLQLTGGTGLLENDRRLALSIRLRNPYVDPMSVLQIDLLQRWREGDCQDEALLAALVACVNGVAQGLQNTG